MSHYLIDVDGALFDISGVVTYDLSNGDISTVLENVSLPNVNLSGFPGANLTGVNLSGVNFTNANLSGVIFDNVSSGGIIPSGLNPPSVILSPPYQLLAGNLVGPNVNLSGSAYAWYDDYGQPHVGVVFESADVSQFDLTNTNFTNANLTNCMFSYVDLTGADFTGATFIQTNGSYIVPSNGAGLNLPSGWSIVNGTLKGPSDETSEEPIIQKKIRIRSGSTRTSTFSFINRVQMKTIKNAMKYNPNKKIGNNNLGSMVSLLRVKARRTSKIHI